MARPEWEFVDLSPNNHASVRALILAGLKDHWGTLDPSLNPDLDDMLQSYATGQTVVAVHDNEVVGTGTFIPRGDDTVEILRMSVARVMRRSGMGRAIVVELCSRARDAGYRTAVLETTTAWADVVSFYLSCGFAITHVEASDFGEDTWFSLDLGSA